MQPLLDVRARQVFDEVFDFSTQDRPAQLAQRCGGDATLHARVQALLIAAEADGLFLRDPSEPLSSAAPFDDWRESTVGPFQLLELLGEGGFGSVYRARQTAPFDRVVALKIIKAGMDTRQVIARFELERRLLALMDHPNIARVLEAGATERGRPYFVMELVEGERITQYCDRYRLPIADRIELFLQVCNAVQHAHQKGIIHRDLKPSNVLVVANSGDPPSVKVIDFGIAKAVATQSTGDHFTGGRIAVGTPDYMSPEQAAGDADDLDTRSDIYSLGVMLYELLTGTTPNDHRRQSGSSAAALPRHREFEAVQPSERLRSLAQSPAARSVASSQATASAVASVQEIAERRGVQPAALIGALRSDLDWIVLKCLERDRARRYETTAALADDLRRYRDNQPVRAVPPSASYKFWKFVQRNRGLVVAGAAIAASMILGAIGTTSGLIWALRERDRTADQRAIAEHEAEQARAVNAFMHDVLTSANPENHGAGVMLLDVLAAASTRASQQFGGNTAQEAQVRDLLGDVYASLSKWPEARAEYQQAAALWGRAAGAEDPRALRSQLHFAGTALNMIQMDEADSAIDRLLPVLERALGPDDKLTLEAYRCVAIVHTHKSRLDEAEKLLSRLRSHPAIAEDDRAQARILQNLISVFNARLAGTVGEERPALQQQIASLARECLERTQRVNSPHSPATLMAQGNLVKALIKLNELSDATRIGREILANSSLRLGECHHARARVMFSMALALGRMGEIEEPADLCLRFIECIRQAASPSRISLTVAISDSLRYLERAGRAREGEGLARELLTLFQDSSGHGDLIFAAEAFLAAFVSMQGRVDEAEHAFEQLLAREATVQSHWPAGLLHRLYASHLRRTARLEPAETHLSRAIDLLGGLTRGSYDDLPDELLLESIALAKARGRSDQLAEYAALLKKLHADYK